MNTILSNLPIIGLVLLGIAVIAIVASGYVKAPTNRAYIISGLKKKPKVLIGRAGIKIPFLERKDELIIQQISIDIKTNGYIPTKDYIGVDIDAVAKIRMLTEDDITVGDDGELLPNIKEEDRNKRITRKMVQAAMKNFLNMDENQIKTALTDSLQGNMREIIGTQTLRDLNNDRKGFGDEVQSKAQKDMNALGVWIESCNIQKLDDENGLVTALGQDNMSKIQKDASIAKAQADMEVAVAQAEARKTANEAEVAADRAIAERNNELEIKKSELKKEADVKRAEADAAYQIQQEEQRKTIEITTANANLAKQEKEIELKEREVAIEEKKLEAEIKKKADADKYAAQQKADAELYETQRQSEAELYDRQKNAEAEKYEAEQKAQAEIARSEAMRVSMENEAKGILAKGEAEAEAIKLKGIAEAEGIEKKAEAMQKYGEAAILEMFFKAFPEAVKNAAEPLGNVDSITMYGNGNNEQLVGSIMNTVTQVNDGIFGSTGIDLKSAIAGVLGSKLLSDDKESNQTIIIQEKDVVTKEADKPVIKTEQKPSKKKEKIDKDSNVSKEDN